MFDDQIMQNVEHHLSATPSFLCLFLFLPPSVPLSTPLSHLCLSAPSDPCSLFLPMEPFTSYTQQLSLLLPLLNLFPFCSLCSSLPLSVYIPSNSNSASSPPPRLSQPLSAPSSPPPFSDSVCSLCSPLPLSDSFCS